MKLWIIKRIDDYLFYKKLRKEIYKRIILIWKKYLDDMEEELLYGKKDGVKPTGILNIGAKERV